MAKDFTATWAREPKLPLSRKIADTMHPAPLQERLSQTVDRLNRVQRKLEDSHVQIEQKHKMLFNKCVKAQEAQNTPTAVMYANECSQVKKIAQSIVTSQLALGQVVLRLETVKDFGDIAAVILPAATVVHAVKGKLTGVIPEVSRHLGLIGQTLDRLVLEAGEATGPRGNTMVSGDDADQVLAEAAMIAEQKVRKGFPDLPPSSTTLNGSSSRNKPVDR